MVPQNSFILPVEYDHELVSCAALGDIADGIYTVDIVNHGASRTVTVEGLPEGIKELKVYVRQQKRNGG